MQLLVTMTVHQIFLHQYHDSRQKNNHIQDDFNGTRYIVLTNHCAEKTSRKAAKTDGNGRLPRQLTPLSVICSADDS